MADPPPESDDRRVPTITMTGVRFVKADWEDFSRRQGSWLGRIPSDPLYCLLESAIARLELPYLGHPPLLDADDAAAERDLLALCRRFHAIGFAAGKPIDYPYLDHFPPRSFREDFPDHGWTQGPMGRRPIAREKSGRDQPPAQGLRRLARHRDAVSGCRPRFGDTLAWTA